MIISVSVDNAIAVTFAATVLILCIPRIIYSPPNGKHQQRLTTALLALHTLYTVYHILYCRPRNIFQDLHLSIKATPSAIRSRATQLAALDPRFAGPGMDELISKISSYDMRLLLIRYGYNAFKAPGTDPRLALLAALPSPVLSYTLRAALIGFLTVQGSGHEHRRQAAAASLLVAFCAELYYIASADIDTSATPLIMPYAVAWSARHFLFLSLPSAIHLLPPLHTLPLLSHITYLHPAARPQTHAHLAMALDRISHRLSLAQFGSGAVHRDATLSARAEAHWAGERAVAERVWAEPGVREHARALGVDLEGRGGAARSALGAAVRSQVQAWKTSGMQPPAREA